MGLVVAQQHSFPSLFAIMGSTSQRHISGTSRLNARASISTYTPSSLCSNFVTLSNRQM